MEPFANFAASCDNRVMLTGPQMRAARALLGWSAKDLAQRSRVSQPTIQRSERASDVPNMQTKNLLAIKAALEDGGVVFLDAGESRDGGVGVRFRG